MPEFLGGKMRPFGGWARAWKKNCGFALVVDALKIGN